jgi:hypothetical protein
MHDIVKTLQDGPESVKQILWSEGPWLGEELEKAWENYYEVQGYSPFATCVYRRVAPPTKNLAPMILIRYTGALEECLQRIPDCCAKTWQWRPEIGKEADSVEIRAIKWRGLLFYDRKLAQRVRKATANTPPCPGV